MKKLLVLEWEKSFGLSLWIVWLVLVKLLRFWEIVIIVIIIKININIFCKILVKVIFFIFLINIYKIMMKVKKVVF